MVVSRVKKGEKTRQHIIEQTALLMNQQGFLATPLSEIVKVTGLQKGGLYNHFADKEELALQAFDYCCNVFNEHIAGEIKGAASVLARLEAFIEAHCAFTASSKLPGGCPIMNASVEASDGQCDKLQERARQAMQNTIDALAEIIAAGVQNQELRGDIDARASAGVIIANVEGGILLRKLFKDDSHMEHVRNHLLTYVRSELAAK
jgi:AcrR family transcriptional regulator